MKILFVCKHNASRSILAEAITKKYLPENFQIASGGSHPKGQINPRIAQYLDMHGFDASEFQSTSWEERLSFHPDLIITVCDTMHNETCPNWLSAGIRLLGILSHCLMMKLQSPNLTSSAIKYTPL
ncbi:low molecular weight phosphatase family protein [Vibrio navarrensis]|uniref:arsenate-mycothiol transferase ArsC n=1 Tax=Vibrio navarrensis TaxID=29495 RepID=UPI001D0583C2|nr:hypothetical protein [Vibrio navarrensis]